MDRSVLILDPYKAGAELCKRKLSFFVKEFWDTIIPTPLIWNWHMDVLCDRIQRADERVFARQEKEKDIIFNVPPGTSKTLILSTLSTCWEFAMQPSIRVFVGSFSDQAVSSIADNIGLVMHSEKYMRMFPDTVIRKDRDSLHTMKTTANGEFYAFTVGGTLTSKHADILKIDDPINPKQATSKALLKTANDFFDNTLPTRKTDKLVTPFYLMMQRLAVNDPTGHLLEKMGDSIDHICLPGEESDLVKPAELRSKYVNGLMDINRLSKRALADLKKQLGSAAYAGQIGQRPSPEGGTIWQRWFIEVPDADYPDISSANQVDTDWDLAYTKEEKNSASAYVRSGMIGNNTFIFDFDWDWLEFPELIKWMKRVGGPHKIENKGPGKSSKQTLKKAGIVANEVKVNKDKIARAKDATPSAEAGFIYIKKSMASRLYDDPKQGILFFPNGEYNDLADVLSQMICRRYKNGKVSVSNQIRKEGDVEPDMLDWLDDE